MKKIKLILVPTIVMFLMITAFGQPLSKNEIRNRLKNKAANGLLESNKALGIDYIFSKTQGTYSDLVDAISINNGQLWDDPDDFVIPIGFDFDLYDITLDLLYFGIGSGGLVSSIIDADFEAEYLILPFETDLIDRGAISGTSQSPISYKLEGTIGNRVFKIEWKNAGFYDEGDELGTFNDYINFQLWLYEGTNDIEIHFGPNMITDPTINYFGETGAIIGLSDYNQDNSYLLTGNISNPTLVDTLDFLNGTPLDGTVYKFSKNSTTGIEFASTILASPKVYPNPTNGVFTVECNKVEIRTYQITDIIGNIVQQGILTERTATIDLSKNLSGVYLLKIDGKTIKLLKQ